VCPSCERHVRSVETTCPFCDLTFSEDFGVCGEPRITGRPLTRAAFILMSATALTACGKSAEIGGQPPVDVRDAGPNTQNQGGGTPTELPTTVYGPAPVADAGAVPVPTPAPEKK
jgi:hypothetical protein